MAVRWAIQGVVIEHRRMSDRSRSCPEKREVLDNLGEKVTCLPWRRRFVVEDVA